MNVDQKEKMENEIAGLLYEVYSSEAFKTMTELCQGEAMVLIYLNDEKENNVNPARISRELDISRQRVTSVLSALRKKGYISMNICEDDRRRMNVNITPEGRKYITSKTERVEKYVDILIEKMGIDNIMCFYKLLRDAARFLDDSFNS